MTGTPSAPLAGAAAPLFDRIVDRSAVVGVVGLGYVGLPLALAALEAGYRVIGFDINQNRVAAINAGESVMTHVAMDRIVAARAQRRFEASADFARLGEPDAVLVCVPTPLTRQREPDLSFVEATSRAIAAALRLGQLVVLESTTWPGTTVELVKPLLESSGLVAGTDFFLAYSPEREDPGNTDFGTATIPKVVGGDGPAALALADALYSRLVVRTVPVSSTGVAEAVKLTENIFRSVNIALVNELKIIFDRMDIDIWEVIEAARSKPFGFMAFYPGPGLGGHCVPIDPFYLTWKAREFDVATRFVELAGQINQAMPAYVVDATARALDRRTGRGLNGAAVLVLGVAYKKNVEDTRESPALRLIELLEERGARVTFHDPHVGAIPPTREHPGLTGRRSVALDAARLAACDVVLVATDHDAVDYAFVVAHAALVVDTRNACGRVGLAGAAIVKA